MSWLTEYKNKVRTPDEALKCVRSGMRVYIQPGCAEPETLVEALMRRGPDVYDVEIVHMMTLGAAPYVAPEMAGHFRHNAVFIGSNVREAINDGRADYTPIYLSEIEELFESGAMPIDVALIEVSPPDPHGFCSFGVGVDTTLTAAKVARYVVAQVNDQMPRTYGDSFIHVSDIDAIVESSRPLCAKKESQSDEIQVKIAANVAGVINGARKNFKPRKIILGFALGTKRLFDFVDDNPIFEFHPTAYTNDPLFIARNDNMVAINSALQVDLTGQVCSDSIGTFFYSGIGGQVDFLRGASRAKGGKPIIAIPSTAKNETISRIAPMLSPGAGVVTSRGLIRYVVTEFGVAYLHGKSIRERAKALIEIAHPKFRNELYDYCERTKWLQHPDIRPGAVAR